MRDERRRLTDDAERDRTHLTEADKAAIHQLGGGLRLFGIGNRVVSLPDSCTSVLTQTDAQKMGNFQTATDD